MAFTGYYRLKDNLAKYGLFVSDDLQVMICKGNQRWV